jgi:lipopolysaccharide biosynthesis regulator YciM
VNELLVFALLFSAIGIGWLLGRRSHSAVVSPPELPSQYYKGLNYLLDGRHDGAIDAFITALEVNSETLETHIALGNLLRKKGEVDRAIRIHQNLLARPSLPRAQVHQAHLELARDYISAGLLDRAERLLLDLVDESQAMRSTAQRYLLEIYQSEREWQSAVDVASQLLPRKSLLGGAPAETFDDRGQSVKVVLAHYYCEMAAQEVERGKLQQAHKLLELSLSADKQCVRASIMMGDVEYRSGHYKSAIKALHKVRLQDPGYIPETVDILRLCARELGDVQSLQTYLQECLASHPSAALVLAIADDIRDSDDDTAAGKFLSTQLAEQPSLRGLSRLIGIQMDHAEGPARENLGLLQVLVNRLVADRHAYKCSHCGFAGRQLHWFCLGCKCWGTMKTISNKGGEEWNHP